MPGTCRVRVSCHHVPGIQGTVNRHKHSPQGPGSQAGAHKAASTHLSLAGSPHIPVGLDMMPSPWHLHLGARGTHRALLQPIGDRPAPVGGVSPWQPPCKQGCISHTHNPCTRRLCLWEGQAARLCTSLGRNASPPGAAPGVTTTIRSRPRGGGTPHTKEGTLCSNLLETEGTPTVHVGLEAVTRPNHPVPLFHMEMKPTPSDGGPWEHDLDPNLCLGPPRLSLWSSNRPPHNTRCT